MLQITSLGLCLGGAATETSEVGNLHIEAPLAAFTHGHDDVVAVCVNADGTVVNKTAVRVAVNMQTNKYSVLELRVSENEKNASSLFVKLHKNEFE